MNCGSYARNTKSSKTRPPRPMRWPPPMSRPIVTVESITSSALTINQSNWIPAIRQLRRPGPSLLRNLAGKALMRTSSHTADGMSLAVIRKFRQILGRPRIPDSVSHQRHQGGTGVPGPHGHGSVKLRNRRTPRRAYEIRRALETVNKIFNQEVGRADRESYGALDRCPVSTIAHDAIVGDGRTDNVGCATGDNRTAGECPADDRATPRSIECPRHATPHRRGGKSRVPRIGRRLARPHNRCPRPAPCVRSPRAFPRRSHRRGGRSRALEARPAHHRQHGRATGCHRDHRHALARRDDLVLAATTRPATGAGRRPLRLRTAPRRRDRAATSRHHRREQHRARPDAA